MWEERHAALVVLPAYSVMLVWWVTVVVACAVVSQHFELPVLVVLPTGKLRSAAADHPAVCWMMSRMASQLLLLCSLAQVMERGCRHLPWQHC